MYNDKVTLVFEGPDGSGKSSIIKVLKEQCPELDLADRGFISDKVYADKFNRDNYDGIPVDIYVDYWANWHKFNRDTRIVFCHASKNTLARRCVQKNESFARNRSFTELQDYIEEDRQRFIEVTTEYIRKFKLPCVIINTDENIDVCIQKIKDFINDTKI